MDEKILAELSLDEYIYLTENLEVIEHGGDKNAAAYIWRVKTPLSRG